MHNYQALKTFFALTNFIVIYSDFCLYRFVPSNCLLQEQVLFILYFKTWVICIVEDWEVVKYARKNMMSKTSDVRGWMALDNVTSHFSTMLELITSATFLSSLSIIHGIAELNLSASCWPWTMCRMYKSNECKSKYCPSYNRFHLKV